MGIITLICNQCGGQISLDDSKNFGFCNHCGTKILLKDDITQNVYNTTNQTIIHKTIIGKEQNEAEDFIRNGNTFLQLGDYAKAKSAFEKAVEVAPQNYLGWLGLVAIQTENYSNYQNTGYKEYLQNALKVATPEQQAIINNACAAFVKAADEVHYLGFTNGTISRYKGLESDIILPQGTKKIGSKAFENTKITSVIMPEGLTDIAMYAFRNCNMLKEITLPKTLIMIESCAFWNCTALQNLVIPDSVERVGHMAFCGFTKNQTISVNKQQSKKWNKDWKGTCKGRIVYR